MIPVGEKVLVRPTDTERKTSGGIIIPESEARKYDLQGTRGTIVAMGPLAFEREADRQRETGESCYRPSVGDHVIIGKYSGLLVEHEGQKYRLVTDEDVIAVTGDEDGRDYRDPYE